MSNHTEVYGKIRYEDVVLDFNDGYILPSFEVSSEDQCKGDCKDKNVEQKNNIISMIPIIKVPQMICLSKDKRYQKEGRKDFVLINLNTSLLFDKQVIISIFAHHKGQLIRNWQKSPLSPILPKEYRGGIIRWFGIRDVTVLRRREDSRDPCNGNLKNEDTYIVNLIMKEVGCIPAFWEHLYDNISLAYNLEICSSHDDYLWLYKLFLHSLEALLY